MFNLIGTYSRCFPARKRPQCPLCVDENAFVSGEYQGLGTRQNSFFSSYSLGAKGWNYVFGQFASQSLPFSDSVTLMVLREGEVEPDTFTIPFYSRISPSAVAWTDRTTFHANNCKATADTNGRNCYASPTPDCGGGGAARAPSNVALPPGLVPTSPLSESYSVAQFYYLNDTRTGVLALGSFRVTDSVNAFRAHVLAGLRSLKRMGAEQLIIDVTNNGGGHICTARWLHHVLAGVKNTAEPQAGLYTQEARAQPLAQAITAAIVKTGVDTESLLLYNPVSHAFANNTQFPEDYNWLNDPVRKVINGHEDFFSQKLGKSKECQLPSIKLPPEVFFDPKKVAIIGNGRCASSCSLFSVTMSKLEGAKTVVFGGRRGVNQQYCGTVGGESSTFATINSAIKTTNLIGDPQAPPDFLTNSVVGINWRLALGIWNQEEPEEWQDHSADFHLDLTKENVNNPLAIWNYTYTVVFRLPK